MKSLVLFFASCAILSTNLLSLDWPSWRGQDRTGISEEKNLLQKWPEAGPKKLWHTNEAGLGYSGFTISQDKLFTLGAFNKEEMLLAFSVNSGKKLWQLRIGELLTNGWGDGPRMSPTIGENKIYALGGKGNLICVDFGGKLIWQKSLVSDLGGKVPSWGYTESVLLDDGMVICTPGGKNGSLAALDANSGKTLWRTAEFTDGAQYSSPISILHQGKKQYVQLVMKNLVGISPQNGNVLWKSEWPGKVAVIPTPLYADGKVYISSGYGVGCKLVEIGSNQPQDIYENKVMKNHHGGVLKVGNFLYGYSDGVGWACQDFNTGELIWNEKKALGKGAIAYADNRLYCQGEGDGKIVLIEASPKGWNPMGQFVIQPQTQKRNPKGRIWTHPVICNGKLFLRDQEYILCYDIKS
ncbi:MAG: polyvinylalcohol dehydrogenase [Opitutae bacterium]|nr:polyvinylalcohol dehydrogenase [Opitutae bacterium]